MEKSLRSTGPELVSMELSFPGAEYLEEFYRLNPGEHLRVELSEGMRWSGPGVIPIGATVQKARITFQLKANGKAFTGREVELRGAELYQNFCSRCNSTDGAKLIGPTLKALWGRDEMLIRRGERETITVDDAYVRESILEPQAAIVQGYEEVPMTNFAEVRTTKQIDLLIACLKSLH